jgi:hypothetical protein
MRTLEQIQKDRKLNKIVAIISALFLLLAFSSFGQINVKKVHLDGDTIITKYGDYISFSPYSKKDTTFLYVYGNESQMFESFGVSVIYPKGTALNTCTLIIGFPNQDDIKLTPCYINQESCFVNYCLTDDVVKKLSSLGYTYLCFDSKTKMVPVTWSVRQRYFVDFFVNYYK